AAVERELARTVGQKQAVRRYIALVESKRTTLHRQITGITAARNAKVPSKDRYLTSGDSESANQKIGREQETSPCNGKRAAGNMGDRQHRDGVGHHSGQGD